jgi:hypothetical protein
MTRSDTLSLLANLPDRKAAAAVVAAAVAKSPRKRKAGGTGKRLETLVCTSHNGVKLTQFCQEAKRIGGGKLIAKRGPCDFSGTLDGGRHITFDAKEGSEKNLLETRESHLPEHQRYHLVAHGMAGAVSGVLALNTNTDRLHWLDWRRLIVRRPSFQWSDIPDVGDARLSIEWWRVVKAAAPAPVLHTWCDDGMGGVRRCDP